MTNEPQAPRRTVACSRIRTMPRCYAPARSFAWPTPAGKFTSRPSPTATAARRHCRARRSRPCVARKASRPQPKSSATYHCLDEPDVHVVFDKPTNRKAIDLLRRIAPTLLFTHPRHDYMLDHEQVHLLARAAAFSYPIPNASTLPLSRRSAIPWLYYCDPVEGRDPYTGELVTPTTYVDVTRADRSQDRNAGLPRVAARLAASAPRHG